MAVITSLNRSEIEQILTSYDVGTLVDYRESLKGIENSNYFLKTTKDLSADSSADSAYVLTVIEYDDSQRCHFLVDFLDVCIKAGLPTAPILPTQNGDRFVKWRERNVCLSPRLPGHHTGLPTQSQCRAVGRFLARLHSCTACKEDTEMVYERTETWIRKKTNLVVDTLNLQQSDLLKESVTTVEALLQRNDVQTMPKGLIHGDLFRDNVLFNEHGLAGVVDFHHVSHWYLIYDIAVAINDWCRINEVFDHTLVLAMLHEYNNIRPLQPLEFWFLPYFLLYSALSFWLSRLDVAITHAESDDYPQKDPTEYERLVQLHASRSLMVDTSGML